MNRVHADRRRTRLSPCGLALLTLALGLAIAQTGVDGSVGQHSDLDVAGSITLTPVSTGLSNPVGIDHHEPTHRPIVSVNWNDGLPYNFELVNWDGRRTQWSSISGLTREVKIAAAKDDGGGVSLGGFTPGELFVGTGVPREIARVSPDGLSAQIPWVVLPGETGLMRGSLYVDRAGIFGGDLIVVTTAGNVWRVTSSGTPTLLASLGVHLEGLTTVPNDPGKYGPWAGKILAGSETESGVYAIDKQGAATFHALGIKPEDIDIIPPHQNFYFFGVDFGGATVWGTPASEFEGMLGDILIAQEGGPLWHVRWNAAASSFETAPIAQVAHWEHVTFMVAGPIPDECPGPTGSGVESAAGERVVRFDGVDDYIEVPNANGIFDLVDVWTIEAWAYPQTTVSELRTHPLVWRIGHNGFNDDTFLLYWNRPLNVFGAGLERASDGVDLGVRSESHTPNRWHHVAGVYDGENIKIYINGVLENSMAIGPVVAYTGPAPLRIGSNLNSNHGLPFWRGTFDGLIDEVRIWSVARTQEEIQAGMHALLTGGEPGLVAYWDFNEPEGAQTVFDLSGNGHHGQLGPTSGIDPDDPVRVATALRDCNGNGALDECDIENGTSPDLNQNGIPDECETAGEPIVPGFIVETYATVTDPARLSFDPMGHLYVGRDNTGSGGGFGDPVRIHRISPGGVPVEEYGADPIADPDSVLYDADGLISGAPGSVLVGGGCEPGLACISAILPDAS